MGSVSQPCYMYVSGILYFVSSTVNPILYNVMSLKYRKAFRSTLCLCTLPTPSPPRRIELAPQARRHGPAAAAYGLQAGRCRASEHSGVALVLQNKRAGQGSTECRYTKIEAML